MLSRPTPDEWLSETRARFDGSVLLEPALSGVCVQEFRRTLMAMGPCSPLGEWKMGYSRLVEGVASSSP
jgi:hypothetical protein